jgi:hypothetical protein
MRVWILDFSDKIMSCRFPSSVSFCFLFNNDPAFFQAPLNVVPDLLPVYRACRNILWLTSLIPFPALIINPGGPAP